MEKHGNRAVLVKYLFLEGLTLPIFLGSNSWDFTGPKEENRWRYVTVL